MGKGRAAGYEAARDSVPKSGIREKIQNVIGLQNLKLCRLHPITLLFSNGAPFFMVSYLPREFYQLRIKFSIT